MKVQVRKCPFTGKLFEESKRADYVLHLKKVRKEMQKLRKFEKIRLTFRNWLYEEKLKLTHPNMIPEWMIENQQTIMDAFMSGLRSTPERPFETDKFVEGDVFTKLSWTQAPVFDDITSNSHVCPDDGERNWWTTNDKPRGYPGWSGYINGVLQRPKKMDSNYPSSQFLNLIGVKTGSGGGGNASWGYDFKLFLSDWPGLQVEYKEILRLRKEAEADRIVARLKGRMV